MCWNLRGRAPVDAHARCACVPGEIELTVVLVILRGLAVVRVDKDLHTVVRVEGLGIMAEVIIRHLHQDIQILVIIEGPIGGRAVGV